MPATGNVSPDREMDVEIGNGRYRLIRRLGEGGTGCVYQAADLLLGRTVAIKALHDRQSTQLLREEARSLAGLNHPNVVGLYDLLESEGRACLVMEYVNGCSLDRWLVERGPLGLGAALEVFRQVAEAVMQAHRQRMLHCDLKPANVLVSTSGQVKLTDFTLARRLREGRFDGPTGGSARYAAPEQLSGAAVSPRTDVYGLGALLRDMIHFVEMASAEGQQVRAAIERATALAPEERFATVEELLAALPLPAGSSTLVAPLSPLPDLTRVAPPVDRPPAAPSAAGRTLWPARSIGGLLPAGVILLATVLLAGTIARPLAGAMSRALPAVFASPAQVIVPDLVATQNGSAQLVVRSLALHVRSVWMYSSAAPSGTVIAQRPAPGSRTDAEGLVTLIVSKGPKPIPLPDLRGLKQEAAEALLRHLGFRVALRTDETIWISAGVVETQSPLPNVSRVPGTTVTLTVSQKPWWWIF